MKRYAKLQRRIAQQQEAFLEDLIISLGFKVCSDPNRPPEGRSVYIEPERRIEMQCNWTLYPKFDVPVYMSVNRSSPTWKERVAQELDAVKGLLEAGLQEEGLMPFHTAQFTDHVAIHVQV